MPTYYVATTGSDSNSGTFSSPWLTIQHACSAAGPGSTVVISSGTYAPFVLSRNMTIKAAVSASVIVQPASTYSSTYATTQGAEYAARVVGVTTARIERITFRNSRFQWGAGLFLENCSGTGSAGSRSIQVIDCVFYQNHSFGFLSRNSVGFDVIRPWAYKNDTGIELSANTSYALISSPTVNDNDTMVMNTVGGSDDRGGVGISVRNSHDIVVDGNNFTGTVYNNRASSLEYVTEGAAVDLYASYNVRVHHVQGWNNYYAVRTGQGSSSDASTGIEIDHNIFSDVLALVALPSVSGASNGMVLRACQNGVVHHNTLDHLGPVGISVENGASFGGSVSGLSIRDNIVWGDGAGTRCVYVASGVPSSVSLDYNLLFNPGGVLGYRTGTDQVHGLAGDPLWVDRLSGNYNLTVDSPAINTASDTTDMGAIEAASSPPASPASDPCSCGVTDTFSRTVAGAFGTSDAGISWASFLGTSGDISVNDGHGRLFCPQVLNGASGSGNSQEVTLESSLLTQTFETLFRVQFVSADTLQTEDTQSVDFFVQNPQNSVRSRITFAIGNGGTANKIVMRATGVSDAEVAYTVIEDAWCYIRWEQVFGSTQRMKIWQTSSSEPASWTLQQSTSGQTSFPESGVFRVEASQPQAVVSQNVEELEVWLDDLDIGGINSCGEPFDSFTRTLAGSIGTSSDGHVYNVSANVLSFGVDGNAAYADTESFDGLLASVSAPGAWSESGGFLVTMRCRTLGIPSIGTDSVSFGLYAYTPVTFDPNAYVYLQVSSNANENLIELLDGAFVSFVLLPQFTASTWIYIKWERLPGTTSRVRVWSEGQEEPSTWHVSGTAEAGMPDLLEFELANLATTSFRLEIDSITFGCATELAEEGSLPDPSPTNPPVSTSESTTLGSWGGTATGKRG